MELTAVAGALATNSVGQTKQAMSISMIKRSAEQQERLVDMIAANAAAIPKTTLDRNGYNFSVYA